MVAARASASKLTGLNDGSAAYGNGQYRQEKALALHNHSEPDPAARAVGESPEISRPLSANVRSSMCWLPLPADRHGLDLKGAGRRACFRRARCGLRKSLASRQAAPYGIASAPAANRERSARLPASGRTEWAFDDRQAAAMGRCDRPRSTPIVRMRGDRRANCGGLVWPGSAREGLAKFRSNDASGFAARECAARRPRAAGSRLAPVVASARPDFRAEVGIARFRAMVARRDASRISIVLRARRTARTQPLRLALADERSPRASPSETLLREGLTLRELMTELSFGLTPTEQPGLNVDHYR